MSTTQDKLLFRKGLLADLKNATIIPGSINFTVDEPGVYLDVDDNGTPVRRRIGDIIVVKDVKDLFNVNDDGSLDLTPTEAAKALPKWSETALYYVKNGNALLKWGGEKDQTWTRLNPSLDGLNSNVGDINTRLTTLTDAYDLFVGTTYPADKVALETLIENNRKANVATQGEVDALELVVTNLSTTSSNTYETKIDASKKLEDALKATDDLAKGAVATNAQSISDINGEINDIKGSITNLNSTLTGDINSAKAEAIRTVTGTANDDFSTTQTIYGLKNYIDAEMQTADAMTFIGVLGNESDQMIQLRAADETMAGDTYKIGVKGSYENGVYTAGGTNGTIVYVGDLLIAKKDKSNDYYHITSGYEDDYNTRLTRYQKWNEEINDYEDQNGIALESIAGIYHGSISFSGDSNTNITAKVTGEPDSNNIGTMNVELSMVWGSF